MVRNAIDGLISSQVLVVNRRVLLLAEEVIHLFLPLRIRRDRSGFQMNPLLLDDGRRSLQDCRALRRLHTRREKMRVSAR